MHSEHFTDADFQELGVEKEVVRNTLKGLVKRSICEIGIQSKEKVDCQPWTAETVRDYVLQFGDFCQGLAEALYKTGATGYALYHTRPETTLEEYAEHFSNPFSFRFLNKLSQISKILVSQTQTSSINMNIIFCKLKKTQKT